MRIIIQPDYDRVSKWTANYVAGKIIDSNPTDLKPFVLGLPAGSSPLGMFAELIELNRRAVVSFKNVITFNMDEYVNLPEDHPQSYHSFMWNNFFSRIDIQKHHVNILNGNAQDLKAECENYEKKIKDVGGIDLFIAGLGPNGHIAFNEPGSSLSSLTRIITLAHDTMVANSRFFDNDISKVPKTALTVGVKTVMDAREVLIIVSGKSKAGALKMTVEGNISRMWTASALQMHPQGIIVCDEQAAADLEAGTVNYFRDVEAKNLDPASLL